MRLVAASAACSVVVDGSEAHRSRHGACVNRVSLATDGSGHHVAQRQAVGLENWKRSTRWREAIVEIGRPSLRVHELRHAYASLARRAGADLRLLQKTMGHASITVTAHIYTGLYDDELDDVASALDALDDARRDLP